MPISRLSIVRTCSLCLRNYLKKIYQSHNLQIVNSLYTDNFNALMKLSLTFMPAHNRIDSTMIYYNPEAD